MARMPSPFRYRKTTRNSRSLRASQFPLRNMTALHSKNTAANKPQRRCHCGDGRDVLDNSKACRACDGTSWLQG